MFPLVVLVWETFQKTTLLHSRRHQRIRNQTKVLVSGNKSVWVAIRPTAGASPPTLVVEPGGTSKTPVSVRDRQSDQGRRASVESLSTLPSRAGRDTSGGKKPWLWMLLFFLSYRWELTVPEPLF